MRTVDTQTSSEANRWSKLRTDAALLIRLARMLVSYATTGRRIRKLYRRAEVMGEVVWVDDLEASERRIR